MTSSGCSRNSDPRPRLTIHIEWYQRSQQRQQQHPVTAAHIHAPHRQFLPAISRSLSSQFLGWGPCDRHNGLSYAKHRNPSYARMLRKPSQAIHSECASRKDNRRRARRCAEGECGHPCQLQGGEPRLQREVRCKVAARGAHVYAEAGETMSRSSCTSSHWVRGHILDRSNV